MNKSVVKNLGLVLLASTTLLDGCRFGNHSESPVQLIQPSLYKSKDLYFSGATQLETAVYLNSISGPDAVIHSNSRAPLSSIPSLVLSTFTPVVYFAVPVDPTQYRPLLMDSSKQYGFETDLALDGSGKINSDRLQPSNGAVQLWSNPNCITQEEIIQKGTFDRSRPGAVIDQDGIRQQVLGDLTFEYDRIRYIQSINGTDNCTADLTRLAACYNDGTGCDNNELTAGRLLFDLYIRQTGVLKIEDAAKVKVLEYIAHYQ